MADAIDALYEALELEAYWHRILEENADQMLSRSTLFKAFGLDAGEEFKKLTLERGAGKPWPTG
jgi:hypothetical protein